MFRRFDIMFGCGNEPGPLGDGRCLPAELVVPIPGEAALLGGVARPKPESVSIKPFNHNTMHALMKNQSENHYNHLKNQNKTWGIKIYRFHYRNSEYKYFDAALIDSNQ